MLRLKQLQPRLPIWSLIRSRSVQQHTPRFTASTRKFISTTGCITAQKQNTRISNLWKPSVILATSLLTYALTEHKVYALETTECNYTLLEKVA